MGKGNWFSSVKKALSPEKSKKKWFGKQKKPAPSEVIEVQPIFSPVPPREEARSTSTNLEYEQKNHFHSAPVVKTEVPAPPVTVEALQRARIDHFAGKSKEEISTIKIQTAFRGHMARRAIRALRGLVRLISLMEGSNVKRQVTNTLRCMQTLARVQSQVRYRRMRMSEENEALQRQILQKHAIELEKSRIGEEWDDSIQSKEQVEASVLSKHEAAMRRERALAYAFSHQHNRKNALRPTNPMFVDPTNPAWGWSWLERWMASRPPETRAIVEKDLQSVGAGEISKAYARSQPPTPSQKPRASRRPKPSSPMGLEDDSKSNVSIQSDPLRSHSIAGSSARDDGSLTSSPSAPSYMTPTKSARAKSRLNAPGDVGNGGPAGAARKRLSFPQSPGRPPRRHSGPPRVDSSSIAAISVVAIGGS